MSRLYAPPVAYADARSQIRDLDVIAFEGRGFVSSGIRLVTGGSVTHVGVAAWWGQSLMLIESREWRGGRAVLLSGEIPPDGVLWYSPTDDVGAERAAAALEWVRGATGAGYSYDGIRRFLRRALRLPFGTPAEDRRTRGARFCSELVSAVYREAGVDLRPDLPDAATDPAALVASPYLRLRGRISGPQR